MNIYPWLMFVMGHEQDKNKDKDLTITGESGQEEKTYRKHAVSSEVPIASDVGLKILKMGGNAVDAAIATCIVVGVVNSFSSGLGGGGFMLIKKIGNKQSATMIDFRETAPSNLSVDLLSRDSILSKEGGLAVGIPGEIKGLSYAHKKFGKLPWNVIIRECINVANGFTVTHELQKRLEKFESHVKKDRGMSEIYTINGKLVKKGDFIGRPNLSKTLEVLAENPEDFYSGKIAEFLVQAINENGGNITIEDFKNYKVKEGQVLKGKYKNYDVYTTGLPSSGVLVLLALNILDKFSLNDLSKNEQFNDYTHVHLLVEIFKFIMAKRGRLGDPVFNKDFRSTIDFLLSDTLASDIYKTINLNSTLPKNDYKADLFNKPDSGTTHVNVVDKDGLVVSLTSTINLEFGAKFMDYNTGIILNNEIDDFYIPNVENSYNLNQTFRNIVSPNKAPLSSAAPIILENKNETLALGAAGGIRIPTSIIEVIFYMSLNNSLRQSINKPRMHHQMDPDILYIEQNERPEIIEFLRRKNHKIEVSKTNTVFTSVQGIIQRSLKDGSKLIDAVSDYRKNGSPAGE
ncbi:Glutathione hydrolase proenzyme 2 [Nosema granulosis]|uniref:Glutathione hydrolase n=1 Tax=Nosema granulosis TaxID=83296 RepID=A0A9P6GYL4_9MICR|nr:Glutathione hydrolase proenzyme 2 [Nosema granulosis]